MTSPQRSFYFYIAFQKNSKIMYKQIIRPLLFLMDPEKAHSLLVSCLKGYRHLPWCRYWVRRFYAYPDKHWVWNDLVFKNRIGLSAGFDKTAEAFDELADLGFGFIEIGTVTPSPQKGNPRPRIFRLVECDSLISRTGFNNPGLDMIKLRIAQRRNSYVLGININKNPSSEGKQAIDDFLSLYRELYDTADFYHQLEFSGNGSNGTGAYCSGSFSGNTNKTCSIVAEITGRPYGRGAECRYSVHRQL